jgi:glycerophosphoryl diester phosphodiesterase
MHQAAGGKVMKGPLIDAHRGECGIPDLPVAERYVRAIELGVDFVEIDIRRIADGEFVNYHDDFTPARRVVRELAYPELKAELGTELTTIDELVEIIDGKVGLHVDVKEEGYEAQVVRKIQSSFTRSAVVFTSGDAPIRAVKDQFPNVRTGLSLGDDLNGVAPWLKVRVRLSELFPGSRLRRSHADFIAVHKDAARARVLAYCAKAHVPAWVWTVDDESEIARFMRDPRVAVLITNRPDVAMRIRTA